MYSSFCRGGGGQQFLLTFPKQNLYIKVTCWLKIRRYLIVSKSPTSYPILQNPNLSKEFVLQTDACDRGIEDGGTLHTIIFISRKLQPREQRYSIDEKECLAIVNACHVHREYLIGNEFVIRIDHFPLR